MRDDFQFDPADFYLPIGDHPALEHDHEFALWNVQVRDDKPLKVVYRCKYEFVWKLRAGEVVTKGTGRCDMLRSQALHIDLPFGTIGAVAGTLAPPGSAHIPFSGKETQ